MADQQKVEDANSTSRKPIVILILAVSLFYWGYTIIGFLGLIPGSVAWFVFTAYYLFFMIAMLVVLDKKKQKQLQEKAVKNSPDPLPNASSIQTLPIPSPRHERYKKIAQLSSIVFIFTFSLSGYLYGTIPGITVLVQFISLVLLVIFWTLYLIR